MARGDGLSYRAPTALEQLGLTQAEFDALPQVQAARAEFERQKADMGSRGFSETFAASPVPGLLSLAIPFAAPAVGGALGLGSGLAASIGGGAALGGGLSAIGGQDPLRGAALGGLSGGLGSLGTAVPSESLASVVPATIPERIIGTIQNPLLRGAVQGSLNAGALAAAQQATSRPDYDPDRPEPDEPPLLDIIIGAPPAPPIDIPPPRLPEEGPVGGGGGGSGGGEPTPIPEDRPEGGREEGVGTGGNWYPCDTSPTGWCYEGQEDQDPIDIDLLPLPGAGGGVDVPATPTPNADVGGGQGAGDGQGSGTGSGTGTGSGAGDGAGEGSGSGDGSGDGDGSGMDLDSMLGMLGLLAQPGAQVTAETPEGADIRIYDLENLFGVSGLDNLYNAPFQDELTLITEELLKAARERR